MTDTTTTGDLTRDVDWTLIAEVSDEDLGQDFVEDVLRARRNGADGKPPAAP